MLILISILAKVLFDLNRFAEANPGNTVGGEWASMAVVVLLLGIAYTAIFFVWQYRIWKHYIKAGVRKVFQLSLIFVFGIFPFLNMLSDLFLRHALGVEEPFTEEITKALLYILLLPITGGK